jgi:hypothetical protein
MDRERRVGKQPIPEDFREALNDAQLQALKRIKETGWELRFIRQPLFQGIVPVIVNRKENRCGVLEENGDINMHSDIAIR